MKKLKSIGLAFALFAFCIIVFALLIFAKKLIAFLLVVAVIGIAMNSYEHYRETGENDGHIL